MKPNQIIKFKIHPHCLGVNNTWLNDSWLRIEYFILYPFKDLFPYYYIMSYREAQKELKEMNLLDPRRAIQFKLLDCERIYMYEILVKKGLLEILLIK